MSALWGLQAPASGGAPTQALIYSDGKVTVVTRTRVLDPVDSPVEGPPLHVLQTINHPPLELVQTRGVATYEDAVTAAQKALSDPPVVRTMAEASKLARVGDAYNTWVNQHVNDPVTSTEKHKDGSVWDVEVNASPEAQEQFAQTVQGVE